MSGQSILILQGGGALGAYECGVYQVLASQLDDLAIVAGTSIGAVNAGLIAKHYRSADHGAEALGRFWMEELASATRAFPEIPFTGPCRNRERWEAVWTSLMYGHPHLFAPLSPGWTGWNFRVPALWSDTHFYDTQPMLQTLARPEIFGAYGPGSADPRLIVTAVDVEDGKLVVFDSRNKCITAEHLVASGSLPPMFPATEIQGRHYWDGGLWSNTPLPEVLAAMQRLRPSDERFQVYIVDVFPKQGTLPQNNWQVWHRLAEFSYADKTDYDRRVCHWINEYIELVKKLHVHAEELPSSLRAEVERRHEKICCDGRFHLDITIFGREAYPDIEAEQISREIDFSPARIEELISQGRRDAEGMLKKAGDGARSRVPRMNGQSVLTPTKREREPASPRPDGQTSNA